MQTVALSIVVVSGLWLVGVSLLMALRPGYCLELFEKMSTSLGSSNWRLQLTEQGLRILAGAALVVRAPLTKLPLGFDIFGGCLLVSSILILALPIEWHASFGHYWTRRLTPLAIRVLSPIPALVGAGIVYAAV